MISCGQIDSAADSARWRQPLPHLESKFSATFAAAFGEFIEKEIQDIYFKFFGFAAAGNRATPIHFLSRNTESACRGSNGEGRGGRGQATGDSH